MTSERVSPLSSTIIASPNPAYVYWPLPLINLKKIKLGGGGGYDSASLGFEPGPLHINQYDSAAGAVAAYLLLYVNVEA